MNDRALRYLGLAVRAGKVTVGVEECGLAAERLAHTRGKRGYALLILASDAASNARRRAREMSEGCQIPLQPVRYTKDDLGETLGRERGVSLLMLGDRGLAEAFLNAVQDTGTAPDEPSGRV